MSKLDIRLITTEGCVSCTIMKNIIYKFIDKYPHDVELTIRDQSTFKDKSIVVDNTTIKFEDYPTTVIFEKIDNHLKLLKVIKGTASINELLELMK